MEGGNAARRAPEPKPSSTDRPIDRREAEQQTECAATAAGTDCCDCYCTARPVIACLRRADGQCLARCNLGSTSAGARPLPALFETARGRDAPSTARPRPALAHMLGARRVPPRVARAQEAGRPKNFATCCRRCLAHRAPCSAPCEPASVPRAPAALHDVRRERCGTAKCAVLRLAWPACARTVGAIRISDRMAAASDLGDGESGHEKAGLRGPTNVRRHPSGARLPPAMLRCSLVSPRRCHPPRSTSFPTAAECTSCE